MRGKRGFCFCNSSTKGLIPACAGKTFPQRAEARSQWAHPRVCGENHSRVDGTFTKLGSSPRVRGKRRGGWRGPCQLRLIPACAGKTCLFLPMSFVPWAHPRVCGENKKPKTRPKNGRGSSPRVRGKLGSHVFKGLHDRLIPACAGKTNLNAMVIGSSGAHPRVCGENINPLTGQPIATGSSPRMRGKLERTGGARDRHGLIPAYAGKTAGVRERVVWTPAHPRVCGENCPNAPVTSPGRGSSPRMRGKLGKTEPRDPMWRLIPAYAGKTRWEDRRPART